MYASIKQQIINYIVLSSLVNQLWVYSYEPTLPGGFPAIAVTALTGEAAFADTKRNRRNYIFRIRCYQERQTVGTQAGLEPQEEAERIMTNLVDSLITVFDNPTQDSNGNGAYNLGGNIQNLVFVQPIPQEWGYVQAPNVDMRVADIKLIAVVVQ